MAGCRYHVPVAHQTSEHAVAIGDLLLAELESVADAPLSFLGGLTNCSRGRAQCGSSSEQDAGERNLRLDAHRCVSLVREHGRI